MKHMLALFLALLLLIPCLAGSETSVVVNRIKNPDDAFAFADDAKLLEVFFPTITGCDAALVRCGEYAMLIDCAGNQRKQVEAMLDQLGVTELTYALNSHPDADHIGGFNHVLKRFPASEFLLGFPEDYPSGDDIRFKVYEDLHALGVPFRQVKNGDTIEFGDVKMTVYQRTDEHLPRVNNKSVMLMIEYGARRIYFTGDIQSHTQSLLIEDAANLDLKADILKFPHHGYDYMQEGFLDMVSPEMVIATGGKTTYKGIQQLREKGIPFAVTGKGIIRLATDGTTWLVERIK